MGTGNHKRKKGKRREYGFVEEDERQPPEWRGDNPKRRRE
jgi:hypothetical protein